MSFMEKMERQWTERRLGLEQVTVCASTRLAEDPERVWDFLVSPESAYLADPAVVHAFYVPGTPSGEVGEQQCIIRDEGDGQRSATLIEVVELQRPVRLVTRYPTYPTPCTSTYALRPEGTDVIVTCELDIWVEKGLRRRLKPSLQMENQSQLDRIAAGIRSGLTRPAAEGP